MSYYYSYPYGPMPHPMSSGFRHQANVYPTPPFPAGAPITNATPAGPNMAMEQQPTNATAKIQDFLNLTNGRGAASYVEQILNYNKGQLAQVHMTFNSGGVASEQRVFTGIIEAAGRDHIILSDPQTGHRNLLLMVYLDYVDFPEEINYYYPGTNTLNIVDEEFFERHPEVLPIYNYQAASKANFIKMLEENTPTV